MVIEDLIKKILKEATTDGGGRGSYLPPLRPGLRKFEKTQLDPFNINVSNYDSPFLAYDSYDGKMNTPKKQIKKIETKAVKFSEYAKKHPVGNDDDGDNINPFPSKIGEWIEVTDNTLTEDLAVWFGEKKKPKGSSQPKGPWVDICRKVNGKHPPCGRSDADTGSYPKCRAAGVAGKMSDSEKRNACQQKRRAEKNDPQSGKGQKPVMVSHKKKTNENMKTKIITLTEDDLTRIVKRVLNEETESETLKFPCFKKRYGEHIKTITKEMTDDDTSWLRKIYNTDGSTTNYTFTTIDYGYDLNNEKFVRARTAKKIDAIEFYCDSNDIEYMTADGPEIDETKQKIADTQWLKGYCDLIKFSSCVKTD